MSDLPIRVLIAKPGLDGHDRGAKVVSQGLRDAGMEVIYTGLRQSVEQIVKAALEEDVDAVGLSLHSGAHMTFFPRIRERLDAAGLGHVLLTGGGIIPEEDKQELRRLGAGVLFGPGTPIASLVDYIREEVARRRSARDDGEPE